MAHKLSGTFKKDERPLDGLTAIEDEMRKNPHGRWFVVAEVVNRRTQIDHEDGDSQTVTAHLVHIEAALTTDDTDNIRSMLAQMYEERTGNPKPAPKAPPVPEPMLPGLGGPSDNDTDGEPVSERAKDAWLDDATAESRSLPTDK